MMIVAVSRIPLPKTERYLYWVRVAKRNDNFRKRIVVSFCSFHFYFFVFLFSLNCRFQIKDKREEIKEMVALLCKALIVKLFTVQFILRRYLWEVHCLINLLILQQKKKRQFSKENCRFFLFFSLLFFVFLFSLNCRFRIKDKR